MDVKIATLTVVAMVLLAGCTFPADPSTSTTTLRETMSTSDSPTRTDTATPTKTTESSENSTANAYPPGISDEEGLHNVTTLMSNHTSTLSSTGFVANGTLETTVERSGFLIDVAAQGQTKVEQNVSAYHESRTTEGGPTTRDVEIWSNGDVEYRRIQEGDSTEFDEREARKPKTVAGRKVMGPFLRGGDYELAKEIGSGEGKRFILNATTYDNEKAIKRGLPDGATAVRSYNSTVIVDREGRIRKFDARIGFVIDGENKTHRVHYDIAKIGDVSVERPGWVDEVESETNALAGESPQRTPQQVWWTPKSQRASWTPDSQQASWTLDRFEIRASKARPVEFVL